MTTKQSFGRVYDRLKEACGTWEELLEIPLSHLKTIIKDAGLSNQKAPRIKEIIQKILGDFGSASLEPLRKMGRTGCEEYLTSLPGVGIKTAKCVMMYSLGHKVLPVDTHVWRVGLRLGLVRANISYSKVHGDLEAAIAPSDRYSFHVNAVEHGRHLCRAVSPSCANCPLTRSCSYYNLKG
jgi:endonuclease III